MVIRAKEKGVHVYIRGRKEVNRKGPRARPEHAHRLNIRPMRCLHDGQRRRRTERGYYYLCMDFLARRVSSGAYLYARNKCVYESYRVKSEEAGNYWRSCVCYITCVERHPRPLLIAPGVLLGAGLVAR